jgi:predicted Zn-dependent protease
MARTWPALAADPVVSGLERLAMGPPEQIRLGLQLERSLIRLSGGAYPNSYVQSAMDAFAQPIFAALGAPDLPWKVTVVDNDLPNAWALPGGRLAIYKGVIRYAAIPDQLAAIIAHEAAHAAQAHLIQAMRQPAFTASLPPPAMQVLKAAGDGSGSVPLTDPATISALEEPVLRTIAGGYGEPLERAADQVIAPIFARTGHNLAAGTEIFRIVADLAPVAAPGTTCLYSGASATAARLQSLESLSIPASASWPENTGFESLKQTFPTREHYRPQGKGPAS